jgi:hypothetical protein
LTASLVGFSLLEPVAQPSARAGITATHDMRRMLESSKLFAPSTPEKVRIVRYSCMRTGGAARP